MSTRDSQTSRHFFGDDTTVRWSCRKDEYIWWLGADSVFSNNPTWKVRDYWQMRDGDSVLLTNRGVDLPTWFELHPSEVTGRALYQMIDRLKAGHQPDDIMDGPNLWRVRSGDRLVWINAAKPENPVKELMEFKACALLIGETTSTTLDAFMEFGGPDGKLSPEHTAACRTGFDAAVSLGLPRNLAPEWSFGG